MRRHTAILLVLATALSGCSALRESPAPPAATGPSAYEWALDRIAGDGTADKDTALAVFSAAFGPLPGVPAVPGA